MAVLVTLVRATPKADPQRVPLSRGHSFIPTQILQVSEKPNLSASTPMMTCLLIPARDMPPPQLTLPPIEEATQPAPVSLHLLS